MSMESDIRRAMELVQNAPYQLSPLGQMMDDLVRRFDPGGYQLQCPVSGCGWHLFVPRMELDPVDVDYDGSGYLTYVEAVPREDVELALGMHITWHAILCETGAADVPLPRLSDYEDGGV